MKIDLAQARALMIAAQGLDSPLERPAAKPDVLAAIRRMGALQIDTIHVIARSPYLVLWSRLGGYAPEWLDDLLAEGALFEYWSHAACFLPIEDYPLYRRSMLDGIHPWYDVNKFIRTHPELVERVRTRLREAGPVRSADFENENHRGNGWWDWKEEKIALEVLHTTGELMILRRDKFQRVYDLRERILPGWDDANAPQMDAVKRELTLRAVRSLGITLPAWVPDYFRLPKKGNLAILQGLVEEGLLIPVEVDGLPETAYVHTDQQPLLERVLSGEVVPSRTTFLSPFDPLVWDRARAKALFNFDYSIECYLPAPKRRYGYFTLPILHRDRLVGRLDPKAYRKEGIFEVKSLHLEPDVPLTDDLVDGLRQALHCLADWHKTPQVVVRETHPMNFASLLE